MKNILLLGLFAYLFVACSKESISPVNTTEPTTTTTEPITTTTDPITTTNTGTNNKKNYNNLNIKPIGHFMHQNGTPKLEGEWHFMLSKGDYQDGKGVFSLGDITWTFHANNTVDIAVRPSIALDQPIYFHNTVTLNYTVNGRELTIDNHVFHHSFVSGKLQVFIPGIACGGWFIFEQLN